MTKTRGAQKLGEAEGIDTSCRATSEKGNRRHSASKRRDENNKTRGKGPGMNV